MPTITNWFGNITSHPAVVVEAASVDDIVAVLKDPGQYPSPVRAVGSNHSTSACGTADGGTLIQMSKMNAIVEIASDTVTAQGGAIYIDVAQELEKHELQFYVNYRDRQPVGGQRGLLRHQGRLHAGRIRAGEFVHHQYQDGAAFRRFAGGHRRSARPDAEGALELRHVRHRLRSDFSRAADCPDGGASPDLHAGGFHRPTARIKGARRIDDVLHLSLRQPDHRRIPPLQSRRDGRTEPRRLAAAQLYVGQRGAAVLLAGGEQHSPTRISATA